jgi:hypothetical protein
MKKIIIVIFFTLTDICFLFALENIDTINSKKRSYQFIIQDSPANLFSMRQFNQNYLTSYRYVNECLSDKKKNKLIRFIQDISDLLFFYPLTHEEGHRSILTSLEIGSISQPYFNSEGAAYVKGVKDIDLQRLRQNDLPNYIRLHTAGLESDYMLSNRIEELVLFNLDSKKNLIYGYLIRKLGLFSYYTLSMVPSFSPKLKEESNEQERDIVGHDVYGAIKNLYRPNIPFYRYTNYDDLTIEEQKFVKRVGYRAFLNLASPLFFKRLNIVRKNNLNISINTAYTMCPFGDFIDENIFIRYNQKYNVHAYLRQFENRNTWFMGGGLSLVDYQISSKFNTTVAAHLWNQPQSLDFNTTKSQFGGSGDILFKYIVLEHKSHNSMSLDLGLNYKTYGFLPEEVYLKEHFGARLGVTINLIQK